MRSGAELRLAAAGETVRAVFGRAKQPGRRTGAVMLTDSDGTLAGIFTDSDLARLFERNADGAFDRPIEEVMTRRPLTVTVGQKMGAAIDLMRAKKVSELPVVDADGRPVGMLDVTDLIGVDLPEDSAPPVLKLVDG
jgi:arabinose-5-phosphate isomerase